MFSEIGHAQHLDGQKSIDGSTLSMTLKEAIDLALQANRQLVQSGYGIEQQAITLESAEAEFDLKFRPRSRAGVTEGETVIGGGVGLGKKFGYGIQADVSPGIEWADDSYTGTTGVSVAIPLLRGFGKRVNLDAVYGSRYSLRTAERTLYNSRVSVVLDTVSAAYDITRQRELVNLFTLQRDRFDGHAVLARIKEKAGLATPIDIYRAEIRQKDAENSLTSARESLSSAEDRLKLILSLPLDQSLEVTTPMTATPLAIEPDEAIEIGLENRIEIHQRKDDIAETLRSADIAKHNLLPKLDLSMDYQRVGFSGALDESLDSGEERWALYLSSDTDWSRTREKNAYRQSLLDVDAARLTMVQQEDEIKREVRGRLQALEKGLERIQIQREQVRQAEEKLALANIKFNHGMADNFDVIEAETERQRANVELISSEIDYIVSTYQMRAAMGTLIAYKEEKVLENNSSF